MSSIPTLVTHLRVLGTGDREGTGPCILLSTYRIPSNHYPSPSTVSIVNSSSNNSSSESTTSRSNNRTEIVFPDAKDTKIESVISRIPVTVMVDTRIDPTFIPIESIWYNCGECSCRVAQELHCKIHSTTSVVCCTSLSPSTLMGLPSLFFTMADSGTSQVQIIGPEYRIPTSSSSASSSEDGRILYPMYGSGMVGKSSSSNSRLSLPNNPTVLQEYIHGIQLYYTRKYPYITVHDTVVDNTITTTTVVPSEDILLDGSSSSSSIKIMSSINSSSSTMDETKRLLRTVTKIVYDSSSSNNNNSYSSNGISSDRYYMWNTNTVTKGTGIQIYQINFIVGVEDSNSSRTVTKDGIARSSTAYFERDDIMTKDTEINETKDTNEDNKGLSTINKAVKTKARSTRMVESPKYSKRSRLEKDSNRDTKRGNSEDDNGKNTGDSEDDNGKSIGDSDKAKQRNDWDDNNKYIGDSDNDHDKKNITDSSTSPSLSSSSCCTDDSFSSDDDNNDTADIIPASIIRMSNAAATNTVALSSNPSYILPYAVYLTRIRGPMVQASSVSSSSSTVSAATSIRMQDTFLLVLELPNRLLESSIASSSSNTRSATDIPLPSLEDMLRAVTKTLQRIFESLFGTSRHNTSTETSLPLLVLHFSSTLVTESIVYREWCNTVSRGDHYPTKRDICTVQHLFLQQRNRSLPSAVPEASTDNNNDTLATHFPASMKQIIQMNSVDPLFFPYGRSSKSTVVPLLSSSSSSSVPLSSDSSVPLSSSSSVPLSASSSFSSSSSMSTLVPLSSSSSVDSLISNSSYVTPMENIQIFPSMHRILHQPHQLSFTQINQSTQSLLDQCTTAPLIPSRSFSSSLVMDTNSSSTAASRKETVSTGLTQETINRQAAINLRKQLLQSSSTLVSTPKDRVMGSSLSSTVSVLSSEISDNTTAVEVSTSTVESRTVPDQGRTSNVNHPVVPSSDLSTSTATVSHHRVVPTIAMFNPISATTTNGSNDSTSATSAKVTGTRANGSNDSNSVSPSSSPSTVANVSNPTVPPLTASSSSSPSAAVILEPAVYLLGTGAAAPSKRRSCSAIYIQTGNENTVTLSSSDILYPNSGLLLDCGEGTYHKLDLLTFSSSVSSTVPVLSSSLYPLLSFTTDNRIASSSLSTASSSSSLSSVFSSYTFSPLLSLKRIWISHMHADHHSGLLAVLYHRMKEYTLVCELLTKAYSINTVLSWFPAVPLVEGPGLLATLLSTYNHICRLAAYSENWSTFSRVPSQFYRFQTAQPMYNNQNYPFTFTTEDTFLSPHGSVQPSVGGWSSLAAVPVQPLSVAGSSSTVILPIQPSGGGSSSIVALPVPSSFGVASSSLALPAPVLYSSSSSSSSSPALSVPFSSPSSSLALPIPSSSVLISSSSLPISSSSSPFSSLLPLPSQRYYLSFWLNIPMIHSKHAQGCILILTPRNISTVPSHLPIVSYLLVYSGDSRPNSMLIERTVQVSQQYSTYLRSILPVVPLSRLSVQILFIHEATFNDDRRNDAEKKRHSTIGEALTLGKLLSDRLATLPLGGVPWNPPFIILTHFSQRYPSVFGHTNGIVPNKEKMDRSMTTTVTAVEIPSRTIGAMEMPTHLLPVLYGIDLLRIPFVPILPFVSLAAVNTRINHLMNDSKGKEDEEDGQGGEG